MARITEVVISTALDIHTIKVIILSENTNRIPHRNAHFKTRSCTSLARTWVTTEDMWSGSDDSGGGGAGWTKVKKIVKRKLYTHKNSSHAKIKDPGPQDPRTPVEMSHKNHHKLRESEDDDETFLRLASVSTETGRDPYRDQDDGSDDIEMIGVGLSETSRINTVTDIGVQNELIRVDQRIDSVERKIYSRGCCGPKRLAVVVFVLLVLLVVNFVFDFWHMIMDLYQRIEEI